MKILKRKSDDVVLMIGTAFTFGPRGLRCGKVVHSGLNEHTVDIIDVDSVPAHFGSEYFRYTSEDGWELTPFGRKKILVLRKSELADLRYAKETGGITIDDVPVYTDRDSQIKSMLYAQGPAGTTVDWKGRAGWQRLAAKDLKDRATCINTHVQACFKRERELSELLENDVFADITTGWPDDRYNMG